MESLKKWKQSTMINFGGEIIALEELQARYDNLFSMYYENLIDAFKLESELWNLILESRGEL